VRDADLAQGVSPRVVMETLGHSQISLTLNTYTHVLPALQRDAAARNYVFSSVSVSKPQRGPRLDQDFKNCQGKLLEPARIDREPQIKSPRLDVRRIQSVIFAQ